MTYLNHRNKGLNRVSDVGMNKGMFSPTKPINNSIQGMHDKKRKLNLRNHSLDLANQPLELDKTKFKSTNTVLENNGQKSRTITAITAKSNTNMLSKQPTILEKLSERYEK